MKILWVQDYCHPDGGAEKTNQQVVCIGQRLGFDIVGITPANFHPELFNEADLVVMNNFYFFEDWQKRAVMLALLDGRVPYFVFCHDYRDVQRLKFSKVLFSNSVQNVFLSPKHLDDYRVALGCDGVAMPLGIDPDTFKPVPGVERIKGRALIPNAYFERKMGTQLSQFVAMHPEMDFVALGRPIPGVKTTLPWQPLKQMPRLYSEAEVVVHLPEIQCAGERVVPEARLCGCQVVMNQNVGYMSWGWARLNELKEQITQAPFDFWRQVERAVA